MNRFSDRRISQKKLFGFRIWRIFYTDLRILLIQRIADLSNILAYFQALKYSKTTVTIEVTVSDIFRKSGSVEIMKMKG